MNLNRISQYITTGIVLKELKIYLNKSESLFDSKEVVETDYKTITFYDMYGLYTGISIAWTVCLTALFIEFSAKCFYPLI